MSKQVSSADVPIAKLTKDVLAKVWPLFFKEFEDLPTVSALVCDEKFTVIQLPRRAVTEITKSRIITTCSIIASILQFKEGLGVQVDNIYQSTLPLSSNLALASTDRDSECGFVKPEDEPKFLSAIAELKAYYELAVAEGRVFQEGEDLTDAQVEVTATSPEVVAPDDNAVT